MDYHPKVRAVRNTAWRNAVMFPEFRAVYALDGSRIVGVAYGHLGRAQQWWHSQIRQAVRNSDPRSVALNDYFEVAEVHVLPDYQGHGVGPTHRVAGRRGFPLRHPLYPRSRRGK